MSDNLSHYVDVLHGFDWDDFLNKEGLTKKDLQFLIYPSDDEVLNYILTSFCQNKILN